MQINPASRVVFSAFFDFLALADHPGDVVSWRHFAMTPLAAAMYPDGVPTACEISLEASKLFAENGIAGTFVKMRRCLQSSFPDAWDEKIEQSFAKIIEASRVFESTRDSKTKLSDFAFI